MAGNEELTNSTLKSETDGCSEVSHNETENSSGSVDIPSNYAFAVKEGKNSTLILCQRCGSIVLRPASAVYVHKEMYLPSMRKKSEQAGGGDDDGDTLTDHWLVSDMYTFENVGFSNTVGTSKYLICADCEIGPIGYHDINIKNEFYIALSRVEHKTEG